MWNFWSAPSGNRYKGNKTYNFQHHQQIYIFRLKLRISQPLVVRSIVKCGLVGLEPWIGVHILTDFAWFIVNSRIGQGKNLIGFIISIMIPIPWFSQLGNATMLLLYHSWKLLYGVSNLAERSRIVYTQISWKKHVYFRTILEFRVLTRSACYHDWFQTGSVFPVSRDSTILYIFMKSSWSSLWSSKRLISVSWVITWRTRRQNP